ncbi:hypothetical protein OROMI_007833 [Orobanche minor]
MDVTLLYCGRRLCGYAIEQFSNDEYRCGVVIPLSLQRSVESFLHEHLDRTILNSQMAELVIAKYIIGPKSFNFPGSYNCPSYSYSR